MESTIAEKTNEAGRCVTDAVYGAAESSKEFIGDHAMSASAVAFGVGLSTGIAIAYLLSHGSPARQEMNAAQRIGRQVLDAISSVVPDSLSQ